MPSPSIRPGNRGLAGVLAVLALAAGGLITAAAPAGATSASRPASPAVVDCDPVGTVSANPLTVAAGGQVTVSWSTRNTTGCNPPITRISMSGPGFNGDETVGRSGSRTVTVFQSGIAVWTLSASSPFGETELASRSATVTP
jgi:hypothetical protein